MSKHHRSAEPAIIEPDPSILIIVATLFLMYLLSQTSSLRNIISEWLGLKASKKEEPYLNLGEVKEALRKVGIESSNLILAIDFTGSNGWSGRRTFNGRCLHETEGIENPYQKVIRIISKTLHSYDDDSIYPAFGFGDEKTKGNSCFPFFPNRDCRGLEEVLSRYKEIASTIELSGPTNFAPVKVELQ